MIAPYRWDWLEGPWQEAKFWQIGTWTASSHAVVLVKQGQEPIYVYFPQGCCLDDLNTTEAELSSRADTIDDPSIYHLLLQDVRD